MLCQETRMACTSKRLLGLLELLQWEPYVDGSPLSLQLLFLFLFSIPRNDQPRSLLGMEIAWITTFRSGVFIFVFSCLHCCFFLVLFTSTRVELKMLRIEYPTQVCLSSNVNVLVFPWPAEGKTRLRACKILQEWCLFPRCVVLSRREAFPSDVSGPRLWGAHCEEAVSMGSHSGDSAARQKWPLSNPRRLPGVFREILRVFLCHGMSNRQPVQVLGFLLVFRSKSPLRLMWVITPGPPQIFQ